MIDIHTASTSVRSKIVQHNRVVRTVRPVGGVGVCPGCHADGQWQSKGYRARGVRFWEACAKTGLLLVNILPITLARLQCKACGASHTLYPDFRTPL